MDTAEAKDTAIAPDLQAAVDRVLKGVRDPEATRRAAGRMDRMREAMPETNVAVGLIRETRDEVIGII
jgi:hypothetical protein